MTLKEKYMLITLSLVMLLTGAPSYAATIYSAGLSYANGQDAINSNSPVIYDNAPGIGKGIVVYATASQGALSGRSRINSYSGFSDNIGGSAVSNLTYDDLIFIDTNNPSSTANVDVSVNFFASSSSSLLFIRDAGFRSDVDAEILGTLGRANVSVSLFGSSTPRQETSFLDSNFSGLYTTPTTSVPLNSFISLNMALVSTSQLIVGTDTIAAYSTNSLVQLAGLSALGTTSFNLPDGISVYSVQGGFSEVGGASVVPVPAAVWLFGSGIIGLIGIARHKKM